MSELIFAFWVWNIFSIKHFCQTMSCHVKMLQKDCSSCIIVCTSKSKLNPSNSSVYQSLSICIEVSFFWLTLQSLIEHINQRMPKVKLELMNSLSTIEFSDCRNRTLSVFRTSSCIVMEKESSSLIGQRLSWK